MRINATKFTDYMMVYMLIAMTGVEFFFRSSLSFIFGGLVMSLAVFIRRRKKLDKAIFYYLIVLLCINLLQTLKFNFFPMGTYLGVIVRILFAYFVIRIVEEKFIDYYIDILYYLSLIAFFFYFTSYIPGVENFYKTVLAKMLANPLIDPTDHYKPCPSFIFYTVHSKLVGAKFLIRNAGPFWEPGAYAGFLT